jgi:hypothetical protein
MVACNTLGHEKVAYQIHRDIELKTVIRMISV